MDLVSSKSEQDREALRVLKDYQALLRSQISFSAGPVKNQARDMCIKNLVKSDQLRRVFDDDANMLGDDFVRIRPCNMPCYAARVLHICFFFADRKRCQEHPCRG
jgi:hypothetical protein